MILKIILFPIRKHENPKNHKLAWQQITNEFNQYLCLSQIRTSAQCQERWKNTLKTKFKK